MNARKKVEKPLIEVKDFTLEEINRGIPKLRRRIDQVKSLDPTKVRYDDKRRNVVEADIRETVREVFGSNSPEFRDHQYHHIWHGGINMMDNDHTRQEKFKSGIPQTVTMLEGLIARLEEKKSDLTATPDGKAKVSLENLSLHPRIASVCVDLFKDEHYSNAVFDASKALVNFVKEKSGKHDLDGAPLMRSVFSKNNPILAFNDLSDQSDQDEQEGMMHLFEGVILGIRNPRGHSFLDDHPERALEYLSLISLLANRLEETRKVK
jgi:uncharacterized protein (TIGR02391 family)